MTTQKILRFFTFLMIISLGILATSCASKATLDTDPELNLKFGNNLARLTLWKEAIARWEYGLKIKPNDARFHNNLAIAYENDGDLEKAEYHYKTAVRLNPSNEIIKLNYQNFKGYLLELNDNSEKKEAEDNDES